MNFKKIVYIIILVVIVICSSFLIINAPNIKVTKKQKTDRLVSNNTISENKLDIVCTNFASYDFIRAIAKDNVNVSFLLGTGKDAHSFEPTAQNLIDIQKSDAFIYIGGEMEKWSDKVLNAVDIKDTKVFCIADFVDTIEEVAVDGAEEEEEEEEEEGAFDEHIWSSPENAIKMVEALRDLLIEMDSKNETVYTVNAENYINEIRNVQSDIQNVVDNKKRNRLVFGDKMPMQYFLNEYGLIASAAFNGCSSETEPSASTIAYLADRVKEEDIPVVLYIELNNGKVASVIANEAGNGAEVMQIQTLHNVSKDDFEKGETYVSLMKRNIDVLKKALW